MILIFVSFESQEHAEKVANYLVDNKLAACVFLIPVKSYYFWKGKKLTPDEVEAIVKTKEENFEKIQKTVEDLLGYEVPQLIAIEASKVNKSYLEWLDEVGN